MLDAAQHSHVSRQPTASSAVVVASAQRRRRALAGRPGRQRGSSAHRHSTQVYRLRRRSRRLYSILLSYSATRLSLHVRYIPYRVRLKCSCIMIGTRRLGRRLNGADRPSRGLSKPTVYSVPHSSNHSPGVGNLVGTLAMVHSMARLYRSMVSFIMGVS